MALYCMVLYVIAPFYIYTYPTPRIPLFLHWFLTFASLLVDIEADKVAVRIVANKALDDDDDKKTHHDSGIKSEAQDDPIPDRLKKWALKQKAKYQK